jgi:hypothetical protein
MTIYSIYRFTNLVNGKVYIGKTDLNQGNMSGVASGRLAMHKGFTCEPVN